MATSKREIAERVLLSAVRRLFASEAVAYLTQQVNKAMREEIRRRQMPQDDRDRLEADLEEALGELDHIRTDIKRGLIGNLTQEMIEQAESKVRDLQGRLATPKPTDLKVFSVLPEVVQTAFRGPGTSAGQGHGRGPDHPQESSGGDNTQTHPGGPKSPDSGKHQGPARI